MEFAGLQMLTWHDFVVELHTGVVVFVVLALVLRVLVDLREMGKATVSARVKEIRDGTDFVAYVGALLAVIFLIFSGITGYLVLPYSTLTSQSIYLNKALVALGALYFWAAYAFVRFLFGPGLWQKRGLYAFQLVIAFFGLLFTTLAGSIGAELTIDQSVMDPVYKALSINFHQLTLQTVDVEATAVVMVVVIILVAVLKPKSITAPKTS